MRLLHVLVDGLLADILILFPVLVLIGCLLAKRGIGEALSTALNVLLGWLVLLAGLLVLASAVDGFESLLWNLLPKKFAKGPAVLKDVSDRWVDARRLTLLLAYVVNIIWARFTKAKYIFLNPVHALFGSILLLLLFARAGVNAWVSVPIVGVVVGSGMAWLPYLADRVFSLMKSEHKIALGSFHTGLLIGAAWLAPRLGGKKSGGKKEGGKGTLSPILFGGALISALSVLLAVNAGEAAAGRAIGGVRLLSALGAAGLPDDGSSYYLVGALMLGLVFSAGLWIIVRAAPVILSAVADGFSGYQRLLPDSRPAMDALFMLHQAPRTAVVGFLASLAGGIAGYYLFGWMGMRVAVPGILVAMTAGHLVGGGAAAIIAERAGGQRALLVVASAHGLVLTLLTSLCLTSSGGMGAGGGRAAELADLSLVGALFGWILQVFT